MSDEINDAGPMGRGVSVTIKYGKGYEETWARFQGTPGEVREDLIASFGLACASDLTLSAVIVNATQVAHAKSAVSAALDATVISSGETKTDDTPPWEDKPGEADPWAASDPTPAEPVEDPKKPVFAKVEGASSVDELKGIYVDHKDLFNTNEDLMAAYKTKGKSLKAAA